MKLKKNINISSVKENILDKIIRPPKLMCTFIDASTSGSEANIKINGFISAFAVPIINVKHLSSIGFCVDCFIGDVHNDLVLVKLPGNTIPLWVRANLLVKESCL